MQQNVIEPGNPVRCVREFVDFVKKLNIFIGCAKAMLQRQTKFVGAFSKRIRMLSDIPNVLTKHQLDFHLPVRRNPCSQGFHQFDLDIPEGSDVCPSLFHTQSHTSSNVDSMRWAVSS